MMIQLIKTFTKEVVMPEANLNVRLLEVTQHAIALIYAACRQCYSPKFSAEFFVIPRISIVIIMISIMICLHIYLLRTSYDKTKDNSNFFTKKTIPFGIV